MTSLINGIEAFSRLKKRIKVMAAPLAAADSSAGYLSFCTFHHAFGYEEFIEGYRPKPGRDGTPHFVLQDGFIQKLCPKGLPSIPLKTYA